VVNATTQLKLPASDGKKHLADMLDYESIIALAKLSLEQKPTDL
tara:strand:- start:944 stop:1075 length:132 start_codon:yes stop_codon:yes gene_type:complete